MSHRTDAVGNGSPQRAGVPLLFIGLFFFLGPPNRLTGSISVRRFASDDLPFPCASGAWQGSASGRRPAAMSARRYEIETRPMVMQTPERQSLSSRVLAERAAAERRMNAARLCRNRRRDGAVAAGGLARCIERSDWVEMFGLKAPVAENCA